MELKGEDLWSYSHKIESVSLRKCPYSHQLTNKAHCRAVTVYIIFQSFTYKMAAKTSWHRYGTKLRHCHLMYIGADFRFFFLGQKRNIWKSYKQERGCLMHFARLANTLLKDEECARDNHVLLVTLPNIYRLKKFSLSDSAITLS